MERIKQALEKAKSQKSAKAPTAPREPTSVGRAEVFVSADAKFASGLESLNYSKTRVVALDALHLERNRIVAFNKNDPTTIAFDMLRTQVLHRMEEKGWRTLAITSPTPGAGKTVVAINLAISIAHQPQKSALLVDFDLRKPKVAAYLGIREEKSLNDVLNGQAELPEAMINPGLPRLVVLPAMKPVPRSTEILSTTKVADLVRELRERYDSRVVLFDLPPLLATDDAITLIRQVDCVLVVVGNGMSSQMEIEQSLRHLPSVNVLGYVLNKSEIPQCNYYY